MSTTTHGSTTRPTPTKDLDHIIEHAYSYFGTMPTGLSTPAEHDTHRHMHSIFSDLQQLTQTILHDEVGEYIIFHYTTIGGGGTNGKI